MNDRDYLSGSPYGSASQFDYPSSSASSSSSSLPSSSSSSSGSAVEIGSSNRTVEDEEELLRKLKVLVVSVEYTMQRPEKELGDVLHADAAKGVFDPPAVPVISVFGVTPAGQKTCMHVHGVMPYLFVECPEVLLCMPAEDETPRARYLANLATSVDDAWRALSHRPGDLSRQIVQRIDVVRGTSFYGYRDAEPSRAQLFLKLSLFDPAQTHRVANVLRQGVRVWASLVRFAPYEVHLPYLLQFFVDYNIAGMDSIVVDELFVRFRGHLPTTGSHVLWTAPTAQPSTTATATTPNKTSPNNATNRRYGLNINSGDSQYGGSGSQRYKSSARLHHFTGGHFSPTPASLSAAAAQGDGPDRFFALSPPLATTTTSTTTAAAAGGNSPPLSPHIYWTTENTPQVMRNNFPRRSWCDLEIDVSARGIHNPKALGQRIGRAKSIEHLFAANPNLISTARHIWTKQEKQARRHGYAWNPPEPLMSDRLLREVVHEHSDEQQCMLDELGRFLAEAELTQIEQSSGSDDDDDDDDDEQLRSPSLSSGLSPFDEEEDLEILGGMVESNSDDDGEGNNVVDKSSSNGESSDDDDGEEEWQKIAESSQRYIEQIDSDSTATTTVRKRAVERRRPPADFCIPQLDGRHDHLFDEISSDDEDDRLPQMPVLLPRRPAEISKSGEIAEDPIMPVEESSVVRHGRFRPFIQWRPASFVSRFSDHLRAHNADRPSLRLTGNTVMSAAELRTLCPPPSHDASTTLARTTRRSSDSDTVLRAHTRRRESGSSRDSERRVLRELTARDHGQDAQHGHEKKRSSHRADDDSARRASEEGARRERSRERARDDDRRKSRDARYGDGERHDERKERHDERRRSHDRGKRDERRADDDERRRSDERKSRERHERRRRHEERRRRHEERKERHDREMHDEGQRKIRHEDDSRHTDATNCEEKKRRRKHGEHCSDSRGFDFSDLSGHRPDNHSADHFDHDDSQQQQERRPNRKRREHERLHRRAWAALSDAVAEPASVGHRAARLKLNRAMRLDVIFPDGPPAIDPGQWLSPAKQPPLEPLPDEVKAKAAASNTINDDADRTAKPVRIPMSKELLTVLSIEILAASRPGLLPDPEHDGVLAICYAIRDYRMASIIGDSYSDLVGLLIVGELPSHTFGAAVAVDRFPTEKDMFAGLGALIREYDPDILLSYELELSSLAYLIERGLPPSYLSRLQKTAVERRRVRRSSQQQKQQKQKKKKMMMDNNGELSWAGDGVKGDEEGERDVCVPGRILINLWRVMRSEVALRSYTLNAVVAEVLGERLPEYAAEHLSAWYGSGSMVERERALMHLLTRTLCNLRLLDRRDILNRTSEQARVFGIDFGSVLTRGTQYRVESLLFRLTKLMNFVLVSPSKAELRAQKAVFCVPLVMEPVSRFYTDPVVVLDFQSLYPSMVIAYNLCYSTCLGALRDILKLGGRSGSVPLGAQQYRVGLSLLRQLYKQRALFVTHNGVVFVKSNHGDALRAGRRCGVLPRLLLELLETRVMVKTQQRLADDEHLKTQLNACQTALKLLLNVAYGYTGAIQTGRMPCADLADSIVQQARVTLEGAIRLVERRWAGARVVYGDTDSLFVHLPGRSRQEAFEVGAEIAAVVTKRNPAPVRLQLEKVYQPCVLVSKKHYCGYVYTSVAQQQPVFDAKGIETVRRDSCALVSQTVRSALDLYFTSQDIERVRLLVQRTFSRLFLGKLPLDLLFTAREVRLGAYRPGREPAHARLCQRLQSGDPRRIALYGERVPYLVVCLGKHASLTEAVRSPDELLKDPRLRINCTYYIEKQLIPPLQRIFALEPASANVAHWYTSLPRSLLEGWLQIGRSSLIASYFLPTRCSLCKSVGQDVRHVGRNFAFCTACLANRTSYYQLVADHNRLAASLLHLQNICRACANDADMNTCTSLDCPVFFTRLSLRNRVEMQANVVSAFLTSIGET